jgi:hypothetical protein
VATSTEPWLLFPLLNPLRPKERRPRPDDPGAPEALDDFIPKLAGGREAYDADLAEFVLRVYSRAGTPGARFFVDKTPAYLRIIDEIVRLLPDSRFVFLARNPLGVLSSVMETLSHGRWSTHGWRAEMLFRGWDQLASGYVRHRERSHLVRYEELVGGGGPPWRELAAYIGIEFDPAGLQRFGSVRLDGPMVSPGEHPGSLTRTPVEKWRETIDDRYRQAWARRYLRWIGPDRLAALGYDLDEMLASLDAVPVRRRPRADDLRIAATSIARDIVKARTGRASGSTWPLLLGR